MQHIRSTLGPSVVLERIGPRQSLLLVEVREFPQLTLESSPLAVLCPPRITLAMRHSSPVPPECRFGRWVPSGAAEIEEAEARLVLSKRVSVDPKGESRVRVPTS